MQNFMILLPMSMGTIHSFFKNIYVSLKKGVGVCVYLLRNLDFFKKLNNEMKLVKIVYFALDMSKSVL